jgi:hypothetical protein
MSIPEETPAAVITRPCSATRSPVGEAPYSRRRSSDSQWLVARSPSIDGRRLADLAPGRARERALGQADARGERRHREVRVEVTGDPAL